MYWESVGPRRFKLHTLGAFCGTHFYKSDTESPQYNRLRCYHIQRLIKNLSIILPLMLMSHATLAIEPIYAFLFQQIRVTPLALHLPIFVKDSDTEFIVNMMLQTILTCYALTGSLAIEIASCLINHAITIAPDLIQYNLNGFRDEFYVNGIDLKSISLLRNTFLQIQDYKRYVNLTLSSIIPFGWKN